MPNRSGRAATKRAKMQAPRAKQRRNPKGGIGALPAWDLSDLYAGLDSPQIARDLVRSDALCLAFEERYKGKLAALARSPDGGKALAAAVEEFESIDDLIGRIASFAGLIHSADTTDPVRAKFFGDVQERITTSSSHLLFFALELKRSTTGCLKTPWRTPRSATTGRGSRTSAGKSPISSRIASSSSSTKNPSPGKAPGTGCSTTPSPACASRSAPRCCPLSRRSTCCRTATP